MSRTEELEKQEREPRWAQTLKLQHWETELRALSKQFWDEDLKNGWNVRYGYVIPGPDPQMTILLTIDGAEFARFVRDEAGIIGVFEGGKPQRFTNRRDAFDAAVKRRRTLQKLQGAPKRTPLSTDSTSPTRSRAAHAGDELVARTVVQVFKGCIDDVLVYREFRPPPRHRHRALQVDRG